jgi:DNA polymerase V
MQTMDAINQRFGSGVVRPDVAAGRRKWVAKAEFLLSRYTTRLEEILKATA